MEAQQTDHAQTVRTAFNAGAAEYDGHRRGLIPCFDDLYGAVLRLAKSEKKGRAALDLGAGTGLLARLLYQEDSSLRITLVDNAEKMLEVARSRFPSEARPEVFVADYSRDEIPGTYDLIVSALSIHHLAHREKRSLFRRIFEWLKPGGVFLNADQILGGSSALEERYMREWKIEVEASDLPRAAIEASYDRIRLDITAGLEEQLSWLREAGFAEVDCAYRSFRFGVFVAIRAN